MPLTDEQFTFLEGRRKQNPPSYYSADQAEEISVSGDIEDALILASAEAKAKALAYVKLLLDANNTTSDYADLLDEYAKKQAENSLAKRDAARTVLTDFSAFKDGLTQGADEELLRDGMTPLMKALNRGIGRINNTARAADFGYDYDQGATVFFNTKLTDGQKRELRSWVRVIAAYQ